MILYLHAWALEWTSYGHRFSRDRVGVGLEYFDRIIQRRRQKWAAGGKFYLLAQKAERNTIDEIDY
jgi:hypothetical protein